LAVSKQTDGKYNVNSRSTVIGNFKTFGIFGAHVVLKYVTFGIC